MNMKRGVVALTCLSLLGACVADAANGAEGGVPDAAPSVSGAQHNPLERRLEWARAVRSMIDLDSRLMVGNPAEPPRRGFRWSDIAEGRLPESLPGIMTIVLDSPWLGMAPVTGSGGPLGQLENALSSDDRVEVWQALVTCGVLRVLGRDVPENVLSRCIEHARSGDSAVRVAGIWVLACQPTSEALAQAGCDLSALPESWRPDRLVGADSGILSRADARPLSDAVRTELALAARSRHAGVRHAVASVSCFYSIPGVLEAALRDSVIDIANAGAIALAVHIIRQPGSQQPDAWKACAARWAELDRDARALLCTALSRVQEWPASGIEMLRMGFKERRGLRVELLGYALRNGIVDRPDPDLGRSAAHAGLRELQTQLIREGLEEVQYEALKTAWSEERVPDAAAQACVRHMQPNEPDAVSKLVVLACRWGVQGAGQEGIAARRTSLVRLGESLRNGPRTAAELLGAVIQYIDSRGSDFANLASQVSVLDLDSDSKRMLLADLLKRHEKSETARIAVLQAMRSLMPRDADQQTWPSRWLRKAYESR